MWHPTPWVLLFSQQLHHCVGKQEVLKEHPRNGASAPNPNLKGIHCHKVSEALPSSAITPLLISAPLVDHKSSQSEKNKCNNQI